MFVYTFQSSLIFINCPKSGWHNGISRLIEPLFLHDYVRNMYLPQCFRDFSMGTMKVPSKWSWNLNISKWYLERCLSIKSDSNMVLLGYITFYNCWFSETVWCCYYITFYNCWFSWTAQHRNHLGTTKHYIKLCICIEEG